VRLPGYGDGVAGRRIAMEAKEPPPAFEDRETVDPHPPDVDPERRAEQPNAPEDGHEADDDAGRR
jgi:hypothetical protein